MLKRIRLALAELIAPTDYLIVKSWKPAPVYLELEAQEFKRLS